MKTTKRLFGVGLIFVLAIGMLLTGCTDNNQSGLTVDEPEITLEYLEGDYVEQLLRDGAEHVFGNIELLKAEDGSILVNITEKEYVEASEAPNGFYIEDKNASSASMLASEARCTFLSGSTSLPQMMSAEEFVEAYEKDVNEYGGMDNPDYQQNKLYDMYIMGDQVELILAKYIP